MALAREERRKLAHLLRRAGFGARPDEWAAYEKMGLTGATERLLNPQSVPDHLEEIYNNIGGDYINFDEMDSVRTWWVYRMVHSRRPLEEKMTLFWHNHFATANFKVNNPRWMWGQNQLFRRKGLGSFRSLMHAVSRDPAMLVWLDGNENRNGQPNENYARELLELFSLGEGNGYTEKDVQEAARCFTGWTYDGERRGFTFMPHLHDDGGKTVLGQTGNFHGDDVVDIVAAHPNTARFVSTRMWKYFIHDKPAKADIDALVKVYFSSGYDISAMLKSIFNSPAFYSDAAMYSQIKSPVEFAVTLVRTLGAPLSAARDMQRDLNGMGQDLFNPPTVKGWQDGASWINSRTLLARVQFARNLTNEMGRRTNLGEKLRLFMDTQEWTSPDAAVQALWEAVMPGQKMSNEMRTALVERLQDGAPKDEKAIDAERFDKKVPGLVELIVAAPEYQLA